MKRLTNQIIISPEQESQIDEICKQLQSSVTAIQVRNWLENFTQDEVPIALKLIEKVKYFTIDEMITEYNHSLNFLLQHTPADEKIFIHALGNYGKSGTAMVYLLKKCPAYSKHEDRFRIISHPNKLKSQGLKQGSTLALLDDITGSGESLVTYYNAEIKYQLTKEGFTIRPVVLSIAYMKRAEEYVSAKLPEVMFLGTKHIEAFASGTSVFGYRPKMLPVRQFCYNYGKSLFSLYNYKLKKHEIQPFGYKNSQSLIVFAHSVPNNTLPIIWSNKAGWTPLFPRSPEGKISRTKDARKEIWVWLSVAYKTGLFNRENGQNFYTKKIDYALLAVMRMKRKKRLPPIICQILGITISQYDDLIREGQHRGLLDSTENLTAMGNSIYDQILKARTIGNYDSRKSNFSKFEQYIPKKFLGKT